jgi:hypothetical protein
VHPQPLLPASAFFPPLLYLLKPFSSKRKKKKEKKKEKEKGSEE